MNLPRFLAARFLRPEGAFLSFVTVAAAGGIALAVAVLVLVLSVANGFERALREEVLGAVPQLVVEGYGVDPADHAPTLAALPGIKGAEPFEELGALALVAQAGARTLSRPVQVLGVAPGGGALSGLTPAQTAALRPGTFGVFLGAELARGLALAPGDSLTLVVPNLRLTLAGAFPVQRTVTVLGLLETGTLLDGQTLLAHLDDVRALARRGGHGACVSGFGTCSPWGRTGLGLRRPSKPFRRLEAAPFALAIGGIATGPSSRPSLCKRRCFFSC